MSKHSVWKRCGRYAAYLALGLIVYVFSSGPVLATSFWLRERTHNDAFHAPMLLYYPLLFDPLRGATKPYIDWWVTEVFKTAGPG